MATVFLKDTDGNILTQTTQQYTVAKIDSKWELSNLMWVGVPVNQTVIHFDNTKASIAPTYNDILANTIAVDYASQRIFDSTEDLIEYKKKIHAEEAAKREYF